MRSDTDECVTVDAVGGAIKGFLVPPNTPPPWPALMVLHPVTGVTRQIREIVHSYAGEGYLALAPDLYSNDPEYRTHDPLDIDAAAHMGPNSADWEAYVAQYEEPQRSKVLAARQWISGRPQSHYLDGVVGAFNYLCGRPDVDLIGSIGYCMGGRLTGQLAALGVELAAGVIYYGGSPKGNDVGRIRAPMEGHYGVTDHGITSAVYEFALAMKANGNHFAYTVYDADHGFNDLPPSKVYNAEAARLARESASAFLARELKRLRVG